MLMISDIVWNEIKNFIPVKKSKIGRPLSDSKLVISGVFYILVTGAQWRCLPDYYGKPSTVHGCFMRWIRAGVFEKIFTKSIDKAVAYLGNPESLFNDTSSSKAPFAKFGGKNPTDRGKNGVKKGIIIDRKGIILSILIGSASRHDSNFIMPHIDNIERFLDNPIVMSTDSAWDIESMRKNLAKKNIALHVSTNVRRNALKRKLKSGGRWRIEQVFGIQQWNRGIKFCWTKTKESYFALCQFVSSIRNFKLAGIFG